MLDWLREDAKSDPGKGSSHTGVTIDFGFHDGQTAGGVGISTELRGGYAHAMATAVVAGEIVDGSARVRAPAYVSHRAHVSGEIGKRGKRFGKLNKVGRLAEESSANGTGRVLVPQARADHSFPPVHEAAHVRVAAMERQLRGAAADISAAFFSALPGIAAALTLQEELTLAEDMVGECPFAGLGTHLYPKGSLGLMPTKAGHDDRNGPSCATFWQNLGAAASGARLEMVAVVHGHDVVVEAPQAHFAIFQAWLPHLTRCAADGPQPQRGDWRLHHTAYWRFGTEYFGWVAREHRLAGSARIPTKRL